MLMSTAPQLSVNVRELLRTPGSHRHVHLRQVLADVRTPMVAVDERQAVVVDAELENVVDGLLVTGRVQATIQAECVRCLTAVSGHLDVPVQELFARSEADAGEDDEPGYAVLPGEVLPLDTMVRDALVLAFPSAPRCRDDCAGLCPECGADRNHTTCQHGGPVDPRWQPLAGLAGLAALNNAPDHQQEGHDARPEA